MRICSPIYNWLLIKHIGFNSAKNPSNQSSVLPPKVQQQRPRSPERNPQPPKEQQQGSSLSSYLQQIHDSQYEQAQQSRFSQGKTRFIE